MKSAYYKFAFWTWYGLVLLSSIFTSGWITKLNDPESDSRKDYFLHAIVFFVFPLIGWYATREQSSNKKFYILMAATALLAIISELSQNFVPGRVFNPMDLVANFTGIIVGVLLISLIKSTKSNFSNYQ